MMQSLEARAPFLDNDLVEFARRLPHGLKYRFGTRKYILKRALQGLIPKAILNRPKKGFGLPIVTWMRHFAPVDGGQIAIAADIDVARALSRWRDHSAGTADHRQFLWCWYALHHFGAMQFTASV